MVTAVIYDLDGTLVDSRGDLSDSVNAMLATLGLHGRDEREIWSFIGEGADRLVRRSLGAANVHFFPEGGLLRLCSELGPAPREGLGDPENLRRATPAHFCSEPAEEARLLARLSHE
jgi:phosphoglycolate phosphatase-like HAD superfamily hydrolase